MTQPPNNPNDPYGNDPYGTPDSGATPGGGNTGAPGQDNSQQPYPPQGYPQQSSSQQGAPAGGFGGPSAPGGPGGPSGPGGGNPSYSQQNPSPQDPAPRNRVDSKGFFAALFDFSFKSYVTIKFAAFIYALALLGLGIGWLVLLIVSFSDSALAGVMFLIFGTLLFGLYLVFIRMMLEFYIAAVRTAQNTSALQTEVESLRWDISQKK